MISSLQQQVKKVQGEAIQREKVLQYEIATLKQNLAQANQQGGDDAIMHQPEAIDESTELKALVLKQTQIHEEALAERQQLIESLQETIMEAKQLNIQ